MTFPSKTCANLLIVSSNLARSSFKWLFITKLMEVFFLILYNVEYYYKKTFESHVKRIYYKLQNNTNLSRVHTMAVPACGRRQQRQTRTTCRHTPCPTDHYT